jgi:hypothetical protein
MDKIYRSFLRFIASVYLFIGSIYRFIATMFAGDRMTLPNIGTMLCEDRLMVFFIASLLSPDRRMLKFIATIYRFIGTMLSRDRTLLAGEGKRYQVGKFFLDKRRNIDIIPAESDLYNMSCMPLLFLNFMNKSSDYEKDSYVFSVFNYFTCKLFR